MWDYHITPKQLPAYVGMSLSQKREKVRDRTTVKHNEVNMMRGHDSCNVTISQCPRIILQTDVPCLGDLLNVTFDVNDSSNSRNEASSSPGASLLTSVRKRLKVASDNESESHKRKDNNSVRKLPGVSSNELKSIPMLNLAIYKILDVIRNAYLTKCQCGNPETPNETCPSSDQLDKIEDGLEELSQLHVYIWEQLNVGHWKTVPSLWRKLYTSVSILKISLMCLKHEALPQVIRECDMGLLMGAPVCNNALSEIAEAVSEKILASRVPEEQSPEKTFSDMKISSTPTLKNKSKNEFCVEKSTKPSLEAFLFFLKTETPVLLSGIIEHWPALEKWDVDYVKRVAGFRTVPVELGQKYTSEDWTQKLMTLGDFIDQYMKSSLDSPSPSQIGYVAQHNLFNQLPSLRKDIRIPEYCSLRSDEDSVDINAWFGPANTLSPTHYDPKHNIFVQVFGSKIIRLFPPSETSKLRPYDEKSLLFNTSHLDVEQDDLFEKYSYMQEISHCDVVVNPGQALFIPKSWWHYVKSLSPSFSVSFWFE